MRKLIIVLAIVAMFLTVTTYASCFQNQTFVDNQSYVYYQVVPKVVNVKKLTRVTYSVQTLRPTPWTYNYPYYQYPYYNGNYDNRYYVNQCYNGNCAYPYYNGNVYPYRACQRLVTNILRIPVYILDGIFYPLY